MNLNSLVFYGIFKQIGILINHIIILLTHAKVELEE